MPTNRAFIDDILKIGENALGNIWEARHEVGAQTRAGLEGLTRKLDLVTRKEFDAAFAMLAKARVMQEDLHDRLLLIEKKLSIKAPAKKSANPKTAKATLRSVKQDNRGKRRK